MSAEPATSVRLGYRFAAIPEWVLYAPDLQAFDVRLFGVLARYGEQPFPKVDTLAERLQASRSTIFRSLDRLKAAGALLVEPRFRNGQQISSIYHLAGDHPLLEGCPQRRVTDDTPRGRMDDTPRGRTDDTQNESQLNENPPTPRAEPTSALPDPEEGAKIERLLTIAAEAELRADIDRGSHVRSPKRVLLSKVKQLRADPEVHRRCAFVLEHHGLVPDSQLAHYLATGDGRSLAVALAPAPVIEGSARRLTLEEIRAHYPEHLRRAS